MVFARNMVEVKKEMEAKGFVKPIVASLAGDVEVEEAAEYLYQNGIPAYAYFDRIAGRGARRQVQVGTGRGPAVTRPDSKTCEMPLGFPAAFLFRRTLESGRTRQLTTSARRHSASRTPIPSMKRSLICTGSLRVAPTPGLSSMRTPIRVGAVADSD